jgi:hypothetical protein
MRDQPFLPPEPRTDEAGAVGSTPHSPPTGRRRPIQLTHSSGSGRTTAAPAPLEAPHVH